jgi:hypothetical protein
MKRPSPGAVAQKSPPPRGDLFWIPDASVEVQDRGQIEPSLIGLDVDDIGEPDPVRRGGDEVPTEQVRGKDMFIPVVAHQRRADIQISSAVWRRSGNTFHLLPSKS